MHRMGFRMQSNFVSFFCFFVEYLLCMNLVRSVTIDLMHNMAATNLHKLIFIKQRNEPHHEKIMSKLVMQPSFRAVGQTQAKW